MATKVSIIVTCFNQTRTQTHMSMLCLDHVRKFTDSEDYELIVVDPAPKFPIRDDYGTLQLTTNAQWIKPTPDPGYTACMNIGANHADCPILVFMQNDVFVREGWLSDLRWYIENGWEAVFPDQVPRSRQFVLESYQRPHNDPQTMKGGRDAGLIMITKEAFERAGKWNPDRTLLAEKDFYLRMSKAAVRWTDTNKVLITHIMAATNLHQLDTDPAEYDRRMSEDAKALN